jgi:hypothetical protein
VALRRGNCAAFNNIISIPKFIVIISIAIVISIVVIMPITALVAVVASPLYPFPARRLIYGSNQTKTAN